jgi:hypothetical protein
MSFAEEDGVKLRLHTISSQNHLKISDAAYVL